MLIRRMEEKNPDLLPFRAEHSNFRGHHPNAKLPAHTVGWEWGGEGLFDESMNGNDVDQSPQKHASLGPRD